MSRLANILAVSVFSLLSLSPKLLPGVQAAETVTCFSSSHDHHHHNRPFLSTAQANTLVTEFNRIVCQSVSTNPISLAPLEGIRIDVNGTFILFQNTLTVEATPPNRGEVVGDFMELVEECFTGSDGPGGLLVETGGGGRTNYIIAAE